jgi:hypothetical protein
MSGKDVRETVGLLAGVAGLVFVVVEMRQNTKAIQAQTRDSITEKQMMFAGWIGTNSEVASLFSRGNAEGLGGLAEDGELIQYIILVAGDMREWENSYYQYEQGLFTTEEFEARSGRWRIEMRARGYRDVWAGNRELFAPGFRAEIDRIVDDLAP